MFAHSYKSEFVQPLKSAENQFLQVLVHRFRISRKGNGFEFETTFNDDSPCIWLREAKRHIRSRLPAKKRRALQKKIEAFFASGKAEFEHRDSSFPFRLGNGGTLPIVRLEGVDYYCLFFRDSHPTGWNIANGGANTRDDLLHPDAIVERELREELIVVEPERGRWYVFDWHDAHLHDHADFARAQQLWAEHFRRLKFPEFEKIPLPLKWSLPPDADYETMVQRQHDAMRIRYGVGPAIYTGQGFLNVNAEDFGIEFDRIAKISVGPGSIFCDGELRNDRLLNRVVGLFEVPRMLEEITAGKRFLPDKVYWYGEDRTRDDLKTVIEAFLQSRGSTWAELEKAMRKNAAPARPGSPFDLCPVTRTIINRHKNIRDADPEPPPTGDPFRIFISFASEDRAFARRVFDHLRATAKRPIFFSDVTLTGGGFADQIDRALDSATSFVAVGSQRAHFEKSWVKYEWRNFQNDMNSNRKPQDSPYFAVISGMEPTDLPRPLSLQQAVIVNPANLTNALAQVTQRIS